jgi:phosphoribosylformylglycinamidine synthase
MKFIANINIMPRQGLLDPQGKAVNSSLHNLGITQVHDARIGKHIVLHIDAADAPTARKLATEACDRLLANMVMEEYEVTIAE